MGVIYAEGIGVDIDRTKALEWLRKAAGKGHEEAANYLKENFPAR